MIFFGARHLTIIKHPCVALLYRIATMSTGIFHFSNASLCETLRKEE